ncbi:MAG: NAD(P)H-hydrate dehydratase [Candidatus Sumerlaeota bacterium]|nr:NAD(P)H-hydrate dehydratase [Candidatus Sumerlaeota bacterium]
MKVATAAEMRRIDERAQDEYGLTGGGLMERAGLAVADVVLREFRPSRAAVVCGKGNNAGDGFVVARRLADKGTIVDLLCLCPPGELRGAAADAFARLMNGRMPVLGAEKLALCLRRADVVVDALLGTGIRGAVKVGFARAIAAINRSRRPVVSVDVPSGTRELEAGEKPGPIVRAVMTVTIGLPKTALLTMPCWEYAGRIRVAPVNFPRQLLNDPGIRTNWAAPDELAGWLPARPAESDKGRFGRVGIVAGSAQFAGAAILAARAALRCGCGLAYIFTPPELNHIYKIALPEAVTVIVPGDGAGSFTDASVEAILKAAAHFDALAVGPGVGVAPAQQKLVEEILRRFRRPIVLDADALTCCAASSVAMAALRGRRDSVLTPHPGEMARLAGSTITQIQADRAGVARDFAARHGVNLLLKGACTVIARPDGVIFINPGASAALAKGGTGDVLTGIIAGLIAQGLAAWKAAVLAAHLHLQAGKECAARLGARCVLAGDIADGLGAAFSALYTENTDKHGQTRTSHEKQNHQTGAA